MKALLSWLRDFVDVPGTAEAIGERLSLRGLALEGLEPVTLEALPPDAPADQPLEDVVLDFEVTANRPDCLSILGLAREVATVYDLPLRMPSPSASGILRTPARKAGTLPGISVAIDAPEMCRRYVASALELTGGDSPAWMQARLAALGVRPISNIVDVTNYVLLELGHPLHAFDADAIANGAIVVRRARQGETLTTLDGKSRVLEPGMLVIADAERAIALAGLMGGANSEVTGRTTRVVLESAWFAPPVVRAAGRQLGLRTEASYRFERGADVTGLERAMTRALALADMIGAGTTSDTLLVASAGDAEPAALALRPAEIERLLGMPVPADAVERILTSLGFETRRLGGWQAAVPEASLPLGAAADGWQVLVPGWRVDVTRPVDLIEEVGRHYGFEHLPSTFPAAEAAPPPSDRRIARDDRARRALLASGCSEAVTFAFIEADAARRAAGTETLVALANPLSETFAVMRPSLLPGLAQAVGHNRRRERDTVGLFEIGTCFSTSGEVRNAAFAWTGRAGADHWSREPARVDFFDAKGVVEQLVAAFGVSADFVPVTRAPFVAGRTAEVRAGDRVLGTVGLLDRDLTRAAGVPDGDEVVAAELDLDALSSAAPPGPLRVAPLPRHPSVVRDISILVDDGLSAAAVRGTIRAAAPPTLVDVHEFDRYQGTGIPDGKVSLSLRLTFRAPDRTLTDAEVQQAMDEVGRALTAGLDAVQR